MEPIPGLAALLESSRWLTTTALTVIGGTVLAIISSSYLRPSRRMRLVYLLFLPGWCCLGTAIFFGNRIERRYVASLMVRPDVLPAIREKIHHEFSLQLTTMGIGLTFFAVWISALLVWWILTAHPTGDAP